MSCPLGIHTIQSAFWEPYLVVIEFNVDHQPLTKASVYPRFCSLIQDIAMLCSLSLKEGLKWWMTALDLAHVLTQNWMDLLWECMAWGSQRLWRVAGCCWKNTTKAEFQSKCIILALIHYCSAWYLRLRCYLCLISSSTLGNHWRLMYSTTAQLLNGNSQPTKWFQAIPVKTWVAWEDCWWKTNKQINNNKEYWFLKQ